MLFRFNRLTLLANIVSLQFTEISEYQPSSSYRASKSRFFPCIHCKFCRLCPTTKMTSATVKPSIMIEGNVIVHGLWFISNCRQCVHTVSRVLEGLGKQIIDKLLNLFFCMYFLCHVNYEFILLWK